MTCKEFTAQTNSYNTYKSLRHLIETVPVAELLYTKKKNKSKESKFTNHKIRSKTIKKKIKARKQNKH